MSMTPLDSSTNSTQYHKPTLLIKNKPGGGGLVYGKMVGPVSINPKHGNIPTLTQLFGLKEKGEKPEQLVGSRESTETRNSNELRGSNPIRRVKSAPKLPEKEKFAAMRNLGMVPRDSLNLTESPEVASSDRVAKEAKNEGKEEEETEIAIVAPRLPLSRRRSVSVGSKADYESTEYETIQSVDANPISSSEWKLYPRVDKKREKQFDKTLRADLKQVFKSSENQDIGPSVLDQKIIDVCKECLIGNRKCILENQLRFEATHNLSTIICRIQKGGRILEPFQTRLKSLEERFNKYLKEKYGKTVWSAKLWECLQTLTMDDCYDQSLPGLGKGKDVALFLKAIDEIKDKHADAHIWEIVSLAFGNKDAAVKKALDSLRVWSEPTEVTRKHLASLIDEMITGFLSRMHVRYTKHKWIESAKAMIPIRNISSNEIVRSLMPQDGAFIMGEIKINEECFYSKGQPETQKEIQGKFQFFKSLITKLYKAGFDIGKTDEKVEEQVEAFLVLCGLNPEQERAALKKNPLPVLDILRLCTMSAWGHADTYRRSLFPNLYAKPYATRLLQGFDCEFTVTNSADYTVKVCKTYGVYKIIDEDNSSTSSFEERNLLAKIPLNWVLTYNQATPKGDLSFPDGVIFTEVATESEQKYILDAVINYKDLKNFSSCSKNEEFLPPVMYSEFDQDLFLADLVAEDQRR